MPEPASPQRKPPTLSKEALAKVRSWITASEAVQKDWHSLWDDNAKKFQPPPGDLTKTRDRYDVNPNVDFRQVEQTKPQLFYATPDVQLTPKSKPPALMPVPMDPAAAGDPNAPPPQPIPYARALAVRQKVLNTTLGPQPDGVGALLAMQRMTTDVLAVAGEGWCVLGREAWTQPTEVPDPMDPTGVAVLKVDAPIYERLFCERISPRQGIIPSDTIHPDSDQWPFIGYRWTRPVIELRQHPKYGKKIPADFKGTVTKDPNRLRGDEGQRGSETDLATGVTIELKACYLDAAVRHPQVVNRLELCDGIEDPLDYDLSPYQTIGPDGRLTDDSLIGFSIKRMTLQDAPDSAYVHAQSSMTRNLVDDLSIYTSQQVAYRDASRPITLVNQSRFSADVIDELKARKYQHMFFLSEEDWPAGQLPVIVIPAGSYPRDNFEGADRIERLIERTHAIGGPQSGVANTGRRSATESQYAQGAADVRLSSLQGRALQFYLQKIVATVDTLLVRYSHDPQFVKLLETDEADAWQIWDRYTIAGRCRYTIKPDSQLRVDAASDRAQILQLYNLWAQDPNVNRMELDTIVAQKFNLDPTTLLASPPPPGPPPPSVSVKTDTMRLLGPTGPVEAKLIAGQPVTAEDIDLVLAEKKRLEGLGVDVSALAGGDGNAAGNGSQPPHGGPPEPAPAIDAHQERRTGGIQGIGNLPGAGGGTVQ